MIYAFIIVLSALLQTQRPSNQCVCPVVPSQEQTRWGNEHVVISTVTRVRILRGAINDATNSPMPNALVEVFTDPDVMTLAYSADVEARRAKQRRIAACFTNAEGKFCLAGLPAGRYELRCSAKNFQAVSQTIKVVHSGRAKKQIVVRLPVAT